MHVSLRTALFLGGFAPLLAIACAPLETPDNPPPSGPRSSPPPPPPAPPLGPRAWRVTIQTNGGFAGSGKGSIALRSDGAVSQPCVRRASGEELFAVGRAVAETRPSGWLPVYRSEGGMTDQFYYTLRLELDDDDGSTSAHQVGWRDRSSGAIPPDLRKLYEVAWRLRDRARCAP